MTTHAVVYTWLFVHIGVILVVTSYYTLGAALAPGLTERARKQFARRPWLPIVVGLAISVPWGGDLPEQDRLGALGQVDDAASVGALFHRRGPGGLDLYRHTGWEKDPHRRGTRR